MTVGIEIHPSLCRYDSFQTEWFVRWMAETGGELEYRRKLWEYAAVSQAVWERGLLAPGKSGLGFAVGNEPLPSLFARYGVEVTATDLPESTAANSWQTTYQWAKEKESLNVGGLCPKDQFDRLVSFRPVDMRSLPQDLGLYDFVWSCCAMEHLGNLLAGLNFVTNSCACLKPGGWAFHTSEYNLSSELETLTSGANVLYRKTDFEFLKVLLSKSGCELLPIDYRRGDHPYDRYVDQPPYWTNTVDGVKVHINMNIAGFDTTSILIMAYKPI